VSHWSSTGSKVYTCCSSHRRALLDRHTGANWQIQYKYVSRVKPSSNSCHFLSRTPVEVILKSHITASVFSRPFAAFRPWHMFYDLCTSFSMII
jgi:hypothetical protein